MNHTNHMNHIHHINHTNNILNPRLFYPHSRSPPTGFVRLIYSGGAPISRLSFTQASNFLRKFYDLGYQAFA